MRKPAVARIWQGRTREALAESYTAYLYEEGVKKLRSTLQHFDIVVNEWEAQ